MLFPQYGLPVFIIGQVRTVTPSHPVLLTKFFCSYPFCFSLSLIVYSFHLCLSSSVPLSLHVSFHLSTPPPHIASLFPRICGSLLHLLHAHNLRETQPSSHLSCRHLACQDSSWQGNTSSDEAVPSLAFNVCFPKVVEPLIDESLVEFLQAVFLETVTYRWWVFGTYYIKCVVVHFGM